VVVIRGRDGVDIGVCPHGLMDHDVSTVRFSWYSWVPYGPLLSLNACLYRIRIRYFSSTES